MNITVKRTLRLIELLATSPGPRSFGFLRENLFEVTPAGLSRLLKDLAALDWVRKGEDGLYRTGPVLEETAAALAGSLPFAERIRPVVERLAERSGHSATYVEYDRGALVHRAKKEMEDSMHYAELGSRNPRVLYNTMGRLCLAWQSPGEIERIFSLAREEGRKDAGEKPVYLSSVENDSPQRLAAHREETILVNYEPEMRTRLCTALVREGTFLGVLGITVPGAPLNEREELFFRKCLTRAIKEIDL